MVVFKITFGVNPCPPPKKKKTVMRLLTRFLTVFHKLIVEEPLQLSQRGNGGPWLELLLVSLKVLVLVLGGQLQGTGNKFV
jgi:hypothetical protein